VRPRVAHTLFDTISFHYGEKEARRKNPQTSGNLRVLLVLYWLFSGYGERALRPILWMVLITVCCSVLYLLIGIQGIRVEGEPQLLSPFRLRDWLQTLHYSVQVMLFTRGELVANPLGYARFIRTVQGVVGPVLLGLFALAVRQQLKR
jgi:hypothetical protein